LSHSRFELKIRNIDYDLRSPEEKWLDKNAG